MKKIYTRAGFTLAELMAVVAIMAILAGIALGSYTRSTERAAFMEGLQNANALAAAVDAYYDENQEYPSKYSDMDISISNVTPTNNMQLDSVNFSYIYDKNLGTIEAQRKAGGNYSIVIYAESDGPKKADGSLKKDTCKGDVDFCKTMGYSSCTSNGCVQP